MKLKKLEKMTLTRETLRRLESQDIREAAGGRIITLVYTACVICTATCVRTCPHVTTCK
jgi:hypothetical protein